MSLSSVLPYANNYIIVAYAKRTLYPEPVTYQAISIQADLVSFLVIKLLRYPKNLYYSIKPI